MKICDLHTHSVFSDGTFTPAEIIDSAINIGLSAVALCDHNTVDGLPDFLSAAQGKTIEAVTGAEFSVDLNGKELHLLGLFISPRYFAQISEMTALSNKRKEQSNIELIHSLSKVGVVLDYDEIKQKTPNGQINRAHIAAALTEKGYTLSIKHAFDTLLSRSAGHYKDPQRTTVWEMIGVINSMDAVPVLAHPFLNLCERELVEFLPSAKAQGLKGMECYYSLYDERTTALSLELAERFGLARSGGSDFHGAHKPDISLGIGKGNLQIPYEWCNILKSLT
ncbi:MAG: PHP domain-containing protein [Clostridia bacterium]|nr:PHP domain-containing protein [Clostridia bacterium]